MKKSKTFPGMMAVAALLASAGASADSMRCGTKLMTDGDPMDKVEALCGPPAAVERREILRPYGFHRNITYFSPVEVSVELWTYNFGPRKLMYRLRFEDGLLVDVATLGYGYYSPRQSY
jgi:hypothetical protein